MFYCAARSGFLHLLKPRSPFPTPQKSFYCKATNISNILQNFLFKQILNLLNLKDVFHTFPSHVGKAFFPLCTNCFVCDDCFVISKLKLKAIYFCL